MVVEKIDYTSLINFIDELFEIDQMFYENHKSHQEKTAEGRVRLGNKSDAILKEIVVSFHLSDVTLFDLDILTKISSYVDRCGGAYVAESPFPSYVDLNKTPDIFHYVKETTSVLTAMTKNVPQPAISHMLTRTVSVFHPVGCIKHECRVDFTGLDLLSLFNGFLDTFIYGKYGTKEAFDKQRESLGTDIYKNFMELFMKRYYQESQKSSLIEDYLINKRYYSYIKKPINIKNFVVSIAKVVYPNGEISFFGSDAQTVMNQLNNFYVDHNYPEKERNNFTDVAIYLACSTDIRTFMLLKTNVGGLEVVDHERLDILYSDNDYQFEIDKEIQTSYGTRINLMLNHNNECRKLITSVDGSELSHPSIRYGMILSGQPIKFLVKVPLTHTGSQKIHIRDAEYYGYDLKLSKMVDYMIKLIKSVVNDYLNRDNNLPLK